MNTKQKQSETAAQRQKGRKCESCGFDISEYAKDGNEELGGTAAAAPEAPPWSHKEWCAHFHKHSCDCGADPLSPFNQAAEKPAHTRDKWASLIEACEMGSESGSEQVRKLLKQRDELLAALKAAQPIVESAYLDDEAAGKTDNAKLCFAVNEQIKTAIAAAEGSNQ